MSKLIAVPEKDHARFLKNANVEKDGKIQIHDWGYIDLKDNQMIFDEKFLFMMFTQFGITPDNTIKLVKDMWEKDGLTYYKKYDK